MPQQKRIIGNLAYLSILFLLCVLPYAVLIGFTQNLILGSPHCDIANYEVPMRIFEFGSIAKGILPFWNPYIFGGVPTYWAEIFYPFKFFYLFLSLASSMNLLILLHQFLAGTFMYFYLKKITGEAFPGFLGAAVFMLSSIFVTRIFAGHLNIVCATAWLPLLFMLFEQSFSVKGKMFPVIAALVLALQMYAGHMQIVFISLAALFLYALYQARSAYASAGTAKDAAYPLLVFFTVVIVGAGVSACEIISLLKQSGQALRASNVAFSYSFSMPPENLMSILSPGIFGWINKELYWGKWYPWEVTLYVGLVPLLLSVLAVAKKSRYGTFFGALLLLSLLMALGSYLPPYKFMLRYMIGFNMFRSSGRFLILAAFSLSALTAIGYRDLKEYEETRDRKKVILVVLVGSTFISILLGMRYLVDFFPSAWDKIFYFFIVHDTLIMNSGFVVHCLSNFVLGDPVVIASANNSIYFLCVGLILIIAVAKCMLRERTMNFLIALVIIGDLLVFGSKYYSVYSLQDCYLDKGAVAFIKARIGHYRYFPVGLNMYNAGMPNGISSIGGYNGLVPRRINEFINFTQGAPVDSPLVTDAINKISRFFQLLNLKYVLILTQEKAVPKGLRQAYKNEDASVFEYPHVMPRTFLVHKAEFIPVRDAIFKALSDDSFDFQRTVILQERPRLTRTAVSVDVTAETDPVIVHYSPNRVEIVADVKADGYLVLCDAYYPGWSAYIDGRKTHVLSADYILRAVFLTAGRHNVKFVYAPPALPLGVFVTALFLAYVGIILVSHIKKRPRKGLTSKKD